MNWRWWAVQGERGVNLVPERGGGEQVVVVDEEEEREGGMIGMLFFAFRSHKSSQVGAQLSVLT